MPLRTLLLGAVAALAATSAAEAKGWYVSLDAGANSIADRHVDYRQTVAGATVFAYSPIGRFEIGRAHV